MRRVLLYRPFRGFSKKNEQEELLKKMMQGMDNEILEQIAAGKDEEEIKKGLSKKLKGNKVDSLLEDPEFMCDFKEKNERSRVCGNKGARPRTKRRGGAE